MAIRAGGFGDDILIGTDGGDIVLGRAGDDEIRAGGGGDILRGGVGDDALAGDAGDDILLGDAGDDLLSGGAGNDILRGGTGTDTASWFLEPATVIDLSRRTAANAEGTDLVSGVERVDATLYDDVIVGDAADNRFNGDYGHDDMTGGPGADQFVYFDRFAFGDTIRDFESGVDELAFHRNEVWPIDAPPPQRLAAENFAVGTGPQDGDDWFILDPGSGTLYWDGDGTGPWATMPVAVFTGGTPQASDILLL